MTDGQEKTLEYICFIVEKMLYLRGEKVTISNFYTLNV